MSKPVDRMQVRGRQRGDALARCAKQIAQWGLKMPPIKPLVLDFGQGDFEHTGLIEFWIANELRAGYCGKYMFVFDGQRCPRHAHQHKHETFFIVRGQVGMTLDGRRRTMKPGQVLVVPPGEVHTFAGSGNALLLELSSPCLVQDNQFQDPPIAAWLASVCGPAKAKPRRKA